jgi:fucose permease
MKKNSKDSALMILYFIFLVFGIATSSVDPLIPLIAEELNVGFDSIGIALFIGMIFLLIANYTAGKLGDRFDTKKIIILGIIFILIGFLLFSLYINFILFILVMVIIRLGYGTIDASIYTYVSQFYLENRSPIFVKLNLLWYLGSVLGPVFVSATLFLNIRSRNIFLLISFLFAVLAVLFLIIAPGRDSLCAYDRSNSNERKIKNQNKIKNEASSVRLILLIKNPVIMTSAILLFFYAGSIFGLSAWLTTYFSAFDVQVKYGSAILSIYWLFSIIGLLITNKLLKKFSEIKILTLGYIIGVFCLLIVSLVPIIYIKIIFLALQALFLSSIFPLAKSIPVEEAPMAAGTIIGLILVIQGSGMMIFQPILGYIAEHIGKNYTIYAVLIGLILGLICNIILFLLLKKKKKPGEIIL